MKALFKKKKKKTNKKEFDSAALKPTEMNQRGMPGGEGDKQKSNESDLPHGDNHCSY